MKRFLVSVNDRILKLYYRTEEEAWGCFDEVKSVVELEDVEHIPYIKKTLSEAYTKVDIPAKANETRTYAFIDTPQGELRVMFSRDDEDDKYYDYCKYMLIRKHRLTEPFLWSTSNPEEFYKVILSTLIKQPIYSTIGKDKPSELRGIKPIGKVMFVKSICQLFIKDECLYIRHSDYFSPTYCKPEDIGTPLSYRCKKYGIKPRAKKFIYDDNWGSIVLRNIEWIKIQNFLPLLWVYNDVAVSKEVTSLMLKYHCIEDVSAPEWERFFESVSKEIRKSVRGEGND